MPQTSIIMPTFNSARFVSRAVESVLAQTDPDFELIISDDGSRDDTPAILSGLAAADPRIRLIRSAENSGAGTARNKAIDMASGRFIAFLDSDDLWLPEKLERQIKHMRKSGAAFCYTSYDRRFANGEKGCTVRARKRLRYRDLLRNPVIGCLTAVYDSQQVGKVYCPDIRLRQDFALWLRVLRQTDYAEPLDETLAVYVERDGSLSANKWSAARHTWKIYRTIEGLGLVQSACFFTSYAAHGLMRRANCRRRASSRARTAPTAP